MNGWDMCGWKIGKYEGERDPGEEDGMAVSRNY